MKKSLIIVLVVLFIASLLFYFASKFVKTITDAVEDEISQVESFELSESERMLQDYRTNRDLNPPNYERLVLPTNSLATFIKNQDRKTKKEAIAFIQNNSIKINQDFCYINDIELYVVVLNFNRLKKIPIAEYLALFPSKNAEDYFDISPNQKYDELEYILTRKFESCYGYNEVNDKIQLILVGKGGPFPTVYLLTYSKESLEQISERVIYKSENTGKETIKLKSCLNNQDGTLIEYEIAETNIDNKIMADTTSISFQISQDGRFIQD